MEHETIGVAVASSGPGAINLISGIANAFYDSIPCLFITGNVSAATMKRDLCVRQNAFQENDIVSMVSKITKYAVTVLDVHSLRYHLERAVFLAKEGRPGPVLLDIPHNIQKAELDFTCEMRFEEKECSTKIPHSEICSLISDISTAKRPIIVVGGGGQKESTRRLLGLLFDKWNIPVVSTLRGLDTISHDRINYVGFGGAYGNRAANCALRYADVVLVLGSRLDERFLCVGEDKNVFLTKNIIHVDIDAVELGRVLPHEKRIHGDLALFLQQLLDVDIPSLDFSEWIDIIRAWDQRYPSVPEAWSINRAAFELVRCGDDTTIFTLDVGINQMSIAQVIALNGKQHCYTSAGHGAMGCSLPLAIGASYASPDKVVNCFVGDGALHMNIQELLLIKKKQLPVHLILINNSCLGMIRDYQSKAFASRYHATVDLLQDVDYEGLAKGYGLQYFRIDSPYRLDSAAELIRSAEPCFIELVFSEDATTYPQIGADMFAQLPLLSEHELNQIKQEAESCGSIIS